MSRKYKFLDQGQLYFVTFTIVYWIDLFIRNEYKDILLESWNYCIKNKGLEVYGWCIMTSHVHMIIGSNKSKMEDLNRDIKKYTAAQLYKAIQHHSNESRKEWMTVLFMKAGAEKGQKIKIWQDHSRPIELSTPFIANQKLEYLHENPVKAGIVDHAEDYTYSSARDYNGSKGLLAIHFLDPLII